MTPRIPATNDVVALKNHAAILLGAQKLLLENDARPWSAKQAEFDRRTAELDALLNKIDSLKGATGATEQKNLGGSGMSSGYNPLADLGSLNPTPTAFSGGRNLKGLHAGIARLGYRPQVAPQFDLSPADAKEMQSAAVSRKSFSVTTKATDSTSITPAGISDYRLPPVTMLREPTRVGSLMPHFATEHPTVTWYTTTGTAAAAAVAEGATKPTSTISYTPQTGTVTKIAHVVEVTEETILDFSGFLGAIQTDMTAGLILAENNEYLNATAAGAHKYNGLLNTSGILTAARTTETRLDVISAGLDSLRVGTSYTEPDGIVMHPSTWGAVRTEKDSQNRYMLGDPGSTTDPRIWGIPVVLTTQIAAGTVLMGDFANSTAVYVRDSIRLETAAQGQQQFTNNTVLFRAELRSLLTVPRPTGLLKITGM